ncbi:MAG: MBL fold metallo-hydrolase [Rhodospirillales bacterium]|nr:MBL fold metallo-hydrolase [Rhodospirillales bacterium]
MQLTLLGTGCPSVDLDRHGPANLVDGGPGSRLLVDCGSGVSHRLLAAGCPGSDIDAVLLTHLHSDHIVDLFQLIISSWHQGRGRPQRIFGPPGTKRYVDSLMALWAPELEQRIAHEKRPSIAALSVEVNEIAGGDTLHFGDMRVRVVAVNHLPVRHAFGFIFEHAAARLAISGDTTYCPALIEAAQGVDMLLHEVLIHRELPILKGKRSAETVDAMRAYHTVSDQVGKVAAQCRAGTLVLTHFVPPKFDEQSLLEEVRRDFDGPVIIGEDLMRLSVS